jgi:hypothetical protein
MHDMEYIINSQQSHKFCWEDKSENSANTDPWIYQVWYQVPRGVNITCQPVAPTMSLTSRFQERVGEYHGTHRIAFDLMERCIGKLDHCTTIIYFTKSLDRSWNQLFDCWLYRLHKLKQDSVQLQLVIRECTLPLGTWWHQRSLPGECIFLSV